MFMTYYGKGFYVIPKVQSEIQPLFIRTRSNFDLTLDVGNTNTSFFVKNKLLHGNDAHLEIEYLLIVKETIYTRI